MTSTNASEARPQGATKAVEAARELNASDYASIARKALSALAITAALAAPSLASAAQTPATIAPGGNITSIVQETAAHGWPHMPTPREARDVANLALWYAATTANANTRTSVRCYFGSTFRGAYCGVRYQRGRKVTTFRWDVKIWEDGSYRFTRR